MLVLPLLLQQPQSNLQTVAFAVAKSWFHMNAKKTLKSVPKLQITSFEMPCMKKKKWGEVKLHTLKQRFSLNPGGLF